jgi:hypothetical protein
MGMLETTAAKVPTGERRVASSEPVPDEDIDWQPRPLATGMRSSRGFRWTVVFMAITLGIGAFLLIQLAFDIPQRRAAARIAEYEGALQELSSVVPDVALVADLITNPRDPGMIQGLVTIVQLDDRAEWVHTIASRDLPGVPPLTPSGAIDELAEVQDRMLAIVDRTETISARLSDTVSYRLAFERAFELPPLPISATELAVQEASTALTIMLADSIEAAANLPDDDLFRAHRGQVDILIGWLTDWQSGYLLALRSGDPEQVDRLLTEARLRISDLEADLVQPLDDMDSWAAAAIEELDARIDEALFLAAG